MARQIIEQPDGKFAEYSTVVNGFVIVDATKEEIILARVEAAAKEAKLQAEEIFDKLESGENPYHQFALDWETALHIHEGSGEAGSL